MAWSSRRAPHACPASRSRPRGHNAAPGSGWVRSAHRDVALLDRERRRVVVPVRPGWCTAACTGERMSDRARSGRAGRFPRAVVDHLDVPHRADVAGDRRPVNDAARPGLVTAHDETVEGHMKLAALRPVVELELALGRTVRVRPGGECKRPLLAAKGAELGPSRSPSGRFRCWPTSRSRPARRWPRRQGP